MLEIFKKYPTLKESLPHIPIGTFPTPVIQLHGLEKKLGKKGIFCKQDCFSSTPYGGNKVRKLEFLLGQAKKENASEIITFGCVGSNHALATAIYANKIGIKCTLILFPQPNARSVCQNLLLDYKYNAELIYCSDYKNFNFATLEGIPGRTFNRNDCFLIPPGGSSVTGIIGYINAAFELKFQIDQGVLPRPDYIFLPFGTMGTASGLTLGLKAAGIQTKVIAIRVIDTMFANREDFLSLIKQTSEFIHQQDAGFPDATVTDTDFEIIQDFYGIEYARYTKESAQAVSLLKQTDGVRLEGTYSGKAMAALIDFCIRKEYQDKKILFWNTYNAQDLSGEIKASDYKILPRDFWWYFENEVQELDRN